jgi:osmotically-inducible protein OsmY
MYRQKIPTDKELLNTVNQKLSRTGTTSNSRVSASCRQGSVTLNGTINHEIQRGALIKAASRVEGVKQVFDQMELVIKKKV